MFTSEWLLCISEVPYPLTHQGEMFKISTLLQKVSFGIRDEIVPATVMAEIAVVVFEPSYWLRAICDPGQGHGEERRSLGPVH